MIIVIMLLIYLFALSHTKRTVPLYFGVKINNYMNVWMYIYLMDGWMDHNLNSPKNSNLDNNLLKNYRPISKLPFNLKYSKESLVNNLLNMY